MTGTTTGVVAQVETVLGPVQQQLPPAVPPVTNLVGTAVSQVPGAAGAPAAGTETTLPPPLTLVGPEPTSAAPATAEVVLSAGPTGAFGAPTPAAATTPAAALGEPSAGTPKVTKQSVAPALSRGAPAPGQVLAVDTTLPATSVDLSPRPGTPLPRSAAQTHMTGGLLPFVVTTGPFAALADLVALTAALESLRSTGWGDTAASSTSPDRHEAPATAEAHQPAPAPGERPWSPDVPTSFLQAAFSGSHSPTRGLLIAGLAAAFALTAPKPGRRLRLSRELCPAPAFISLLERPG